MSAKLKGLHGATSLLGKAWGHVIVNCYATAKKRRGFEAQVIPSCLFILYFIEPLFH